MLFFPFFIVFALGLDQLLVSTGVWGLCENGSTQITSQNFVT